MSLCGNKAFYILVTICLTVSQSLNTRGQVQSNDHVTDSLDTMPTSDSVIREEVDRPRYQTIEGKVKSPSPKVSKCSKPSYKFTIATVCK